MQSQSCSAASGANSYFLLASTNGPFGLSDLFGRLTFRNVRLASVVSEGLTLCGKIQSVVILRPLLSFYIS